jgi:hypothetical protein
MSEHDGDFGHCWECHGDDGIHYPGCIYDGTGKRGESCRMGGSDGAKVVFFIFFMIGVFVAALVPPLGIGIIILGAKITNV